MAEWESVIGLEIHVQLKTRTKMFCGCEAGFGGEPNTRTCPVCLAFPGALPVPNATAVEWTIKLGHALNCRIADHAVFHRKNYFYPDNPKGYQISQYDEPLCLDGSFVVPAEDGDSVVGIVRAHLEEDAAKTVHVGGATGRIVGAAHSNVDFNRGGTPLVEIVTRPDIRSAEQAKRFLQLLRQTIVELGISDAEMEKGTLRADANVSVRQVGETGYRTRSELKNMNSFNHIARGIDAELRRQIETWESGREVVQETLDYEVKSDTVTPRRRKEEADDYRYFPEPDLVPLAPQRDLVERLHGELPELPGARIRRFEEQYGLSYYDAEVLNGSAALAALYEHRFSRLPVHRGDRDNVIGVLYAKDLCGLDVAAPGFRLEPLLRPPTFVPVSTRASDVFRELRRRKVHLALVVDEYGGIAGLVTMEDLLGELFGDVAAEYQEARAR